jgi:hypothetical protein
MCFILSPIERTRRSCGVFRAWRKLREANRRRYTLAPSDEACRHDDDSMTDAH